MTAIRLIQKPVDGKIIFDVPEEMRDETIVIDFRPASEAQEMALPERSRELLQRLPNPTPNLDWNQLNVYEQ
ncbi:hypothetical protein FAES_1607 [Fibrella aestuarina BUZ 2]|uniref:Uncharacterized protein n=1 Tax=Fibrella aestuarina BUZ 2 TaxID=1166018 RepID=I0K664_9BACT|nr:hypothetical protein [Fibrella aestuarina]CCG99617.1 hypothetical protein FAES_1607 [Fibrella aestuarina BUZ 2]